jgi:inorganic pyrophosphatase
MTDDGGEDAKVIAVPHDKLTTIYKNVKELEDLPPLLLEQIKHFFENYKDLEPGKWVKLAGWFNSDTAREIIKAGVTAYNKK